jgi:hypothetical protein
MDGMTEEGNFRDYESVIIREMSVIHTETPKKFFLCTSGK